MTVGSNPVERQIDDLRSLIGSTVTGPLERVERNSIIEFAEAIRWPDEPLARYVRDERDLLAPPTFATRFARQRGYSLPMPVPDWWRAIPGILASTSITQPAPFRVGEEVTTIATIRDVVVQPGPKGRLVGIVRDFDFLNAQGAVVASTRRTIAKFVDGPMYDRSDVADEIGRLSDPDSGDHGDLPTFTRLVTLAELNRFAGANREWGQYHYDPEYARTLGLRDALILENLKLAYLGNMLEDWLGDRGRVVRLAATFKSLDVAGDTLTAHGRTISDSGSRSVVRVWLTNQDGRVGTIGEAEVVADGR